MLTIEVTRSSAGYYQIPGAAEPELLDSVAAEMDSLTHEGPLVGWAPWTQVWSAIDADGEERWYFAFPLPEEGVIEELRLAAEAAGDEETVDLCERAAEDGRALVACLAAIASGED